MQLTMDNELRTQGVFVMFVFTHYYLRVIADLNEIIRAMPALSLKAQGTYQCLHVLRNRRFKFNGCFRNRMDNFQAPSMQHLSGDSTENI